ncbi:MAG: YdjY domain-containing protein [Planctomycetota bacterium]|nr:YdjY domain-containing protein [Planctomycetota bacterium]
MKRSAAIVTTFIALLSASSLLAQEKPKQDEKKAKKQDEKPGDKPKSKKPGDGKKTVTKLPGINIHRTEKLIEIEGFICRQKSSQLEVLACTKKGKTHESLLLLNCAAEHLQLGLLLFGLKPVPQVKTFGEVKALDKGSKVVIEVEWTEKKRMILCAACFKGACKLHKNPMDCKTCVQIKAKDDGGWCENCLQGQRWERRVTCKKCWLRTCNGHFTRECVECKKFKDGKRETHCEGAVNHGDLDCRDCYLAERSGQGWCKKCQRGFKGGVKVRHRVEDLVLNRHTEKTMKRAGFVFTGSRQIEVPAPPNFDKKKRVFAAKHSGNVAVLFHDPDAILDTPLLEGGDDTAFLPNAPVLPKRFTPVTIYVRPWTKKDDAAAKKADTNKDAAKKDSKPDEKKKDKKKKD